MSCKLSLQNFFGPRVTTSESTKKGIKRVMGIRHRSVENTDVVTAVLTITFHRPRPCRRVAQWGPVTRTPAPWSRLASEATQRTTTRSVAAILDHNPACRPPGAKGGGWQSGGGGYLGSDKQIRNRTL